VTRWKNCFVTLLRFPILILFNYELKRDFNFDNRDTNSSHFMQVPVNTVMGDSAGR